MAIVSINNKDFSNIFTTWEDMTSRGLYERIPYARYLRLKKLFINYQCDCGKPLNEVNIIFTSGVVAIKCPHCSARVEFSKSDYMGTALTKYVELRKDMSLRDKDKAETNDYFNQRVSSTQIANNANQYATIDSNYILSGKLENVATVYDGSALRADVVATPTKYEIYSDNKGGNNNMINVNSMFKGFQFGPVKGDNFKLSPLGTAFKSKDGYVVYNVKNDEVTDVTGMTFDMNDMIFAMPVSHKKVAEGDIIIHNNQPVIVKELKEKSIVVVFPGMSEIKEIMPTKNMFGFNFYTKITPLLDLSGAAKPDSENPFGNLMPLMMMSQGANGGGMNPMMLMALMGDKLGGDGEDKSGFSKEMMMALAFSGNSGAGGNDMMTALMMSKLF